MFLRLSLFLTALLLGSTSEAQMLNYPVRQLGVKDGLPQGSVYSLFQSREGFIWIGTGDGLARWDGRHFRSFRGPYKDTSGRSLSTRMVSGPMVEDDWGRIWFTTNMGLACYDTRRQRFRPIQVPTGKPELLSILGIMPPRRLVFGDKHQVWILDLRRASTGFQPLTTQSSIPYSSALLRGDTLYYELPAGLFARKLPLGKPWLLLRNSRITALLSGGTSDVFAWAGDSLFEIRAGHCIASLPLPASLQQIAFSPMLYAGDGAWWGMSQRGFTEAHIPQGSYRFLPVGKEPSRSLNSALILLMMQDGSGNIWVGTEGSGINVVDTKGFKFQTCMLPPGPRGSQPEMMVKSMLEVGGRLWVGSFSQGLFILDRTSRTLQNIHPIPGNKGRISLLHRDREGRIWMNVEDRIGIVDSLRGQFLQSVRIPDEESNNVAALSFCEYQPGRFLLGSIFGMHRMWLEAGKIRIQRFARRFEATQGQITSMTQAPDHSIFIGKVRDGFYRLRIFPDQDSIQILDEGFHLTGIRDIQFLQSGKYACMATENGLLFYEPHTRRYQFFDEKNGFSNSHVYGFLREGDSVFWLSTNRGINQLQFSGWDAGPQLRSVRAFTEEDGLQSNEFNTGAFCRTTDGALAFGGVMGLNWFYPGRLLKNPFPPVAVITDIRVNEQPLHSDTDVCYLRRIELPYDSSTLAFSFAALEFTNPAANRCQYMLKGFDAAWVDAGEGLTARYSNLPPGKYQFLLRAANNDAVWNENPISLQVLIHPPWWQQWWALAAAVLCALLLFFFIVRIIIRRKVAAQKRLMERQEAINEERLRISRDMHDDLGTGLTKIALLSEVARRKGAGQQPSSLSEIAETSRSLTQRISEIVWTLNPQNDKLDTLAAYLREYGQEHFEPFEKPVFLTEFPDEIPPVPLSHRVRQALLLVIKEALNNALKYADARTIRIGLQIGEQEILFSVRDDGCGFLAPQEGNGRQLGGNGLNNMKLRMESMGGHFEWHSKPGVGTSLFFSFPR